MCLGHWFPSTKQAWQINGIDYLQLITTCAFVSSSCALTPMHYAWTSYHALSSWDGFKHNNYWKFSEQAWATKIETPARLEKNIPEQKRNTLRGDHIELAIFNMSMWFGTSGFTNSSSYLLDMELKLHLFHNRHVHSPTESPLSLLIKDEIWSRSN